MTLSWLPYADGRSPWHQAHVVVAGIGVSGFAAGDGLLQFGGRLTILDDLLD
jgi:UDP-N-acetylmuramoylalanine--D-glutamate ligase